MFADRPDSAVHRREARLRVRRGDAEDGDGDYGETFLGYFIYHHLHKRHRMSENDEIPYGAWKPITLSHIITLHLFIFKQVKYIIPQVITETTTVTEERYKPQNPEAMNETMFSESEEEADDHHVTANAHVKDFNDSLTAGLQDSTGVHLIHTGETTVRITFMTRV